MTREILLFLPGMMCDARLFAPQLAAFEPVCDVRVAALTGAASVTQLADQILQDLPDRNLNLAGLSMGGIVAMEMARLAPQRIARLALLDTNHLADAPERRQIRDTQIAAVRGGALRQVIVEEMKPNYLAARHRDNKQLLALLIDMAMGLGRDVFVDQSLALRDRPDQTGTLMAVLAPTLILHGVEDTLCTPQRHLEMAALVKTAQLVPVPDAGHITPLENPGAVNAALSDWLARSV
uniref:alpha/beta fold hydrolase n=1 Tax=Pararhizobium sp. IMCC3301 TaxID=3067904 RepID=UPI002741BD11|nr:alpha/beta fold hydrolase [Pararhizobium sp. IMCC3301]